MSIGDIAIIIIGLTSLIIGIKIFLAETEDEKLQRKNIDIVPGMALFRFALYRWLMSVIFLVIGLFCLAFAFGFL